MTTAKYDLPTAIRIGAKIRPQCRDLYHRNGESCVLGAAFEAEGIRPYTDPQLFELWPELRMQVDPEHALFSALTFLNDDARWTREEIADWLEVILP